MLRLRFSGPGLPAAFTHGGQLVGSGGAKMRKLMLAATIAALPSFAIAADDQLAGTYRLISSTRTILETGEVLDTW